MSVENNPLLCGLDHMHGLSRELVQALTHVVKGMRGNVLVKAPPTGETTATLLGHDGVGVKSLPHKSFLGV